MRWNLQVFLSKRNCILDALNTLDHVLEINSRRYTASVSYLIVDYVTQQLKSME